MKCHPKQLPPRRNAKGAKGIFAARNQYFVSRDCLRIQSILCSYLLGALGVPLRLGGSLFSFSRTQDFIPISSSLRGVHSDAECIRVNVKMSSAPG
jgi:hypothetical protein